VPPAPSPPPAPDGRPDRPWSLGIGLLLLGLLVSSSGNAVALKNPGSDGARLLANTFYPVGLLVAGWGVHRILWPEPSRTPAWQRVLLTALATLPAFALLGTLLGVLLLIGMSRFG
jgi:hypothetical protein